MALDSKGREANPLDKYRSVSYHHILLASDTTEALREIQDASDSGNFTTAQFDNAVINRPITGTNKNGSGGVYVVIDGRKTSTISIKSITYDTATQGGTSLSEVNILASPYVTVEITDVYGVTFLNYLQFLCDEALQCDFAGIHWTLQTIFVGHTDDGQTETILGNNLNLMTGNMDVDFDASGGHYKIDFMGTISDAAVMTAQMGRVGQSSTALKSDNNRTLLSVIQDFQNHMNKESQDYYDKLRLTILPAAGGADGNNVKTDVPQVGRLVQYMFTIPDEWKTYTVDGGAAGHTEVNWKDKRTSTSTATQQSQPKDSPATPNTAKGSVTINLHAQISVSEALSEILKHCDQLLAQAGNDKRINGNEVKLWKIEPHTTSDSKSVCLHWDIFTYNAPNVNTSNGANSSREVPTEEKNWDKTTDSAGNTVYAPKNSLTFDYIFSGKNKDILHIDMKIPMAQQLLMNASTRFDTASKALQNQKNNAKAKPTDQKKELVFVQKNTPIFLPIKTGDQLTAYSSINPGSSQSSRVRQEFYKTVAETAGLVGGQVKLTIRGNPILMLHTSPKIAPHVSGPITAQSTNDSNYRAYLKKRTSGITSEASDVLPKDPATYPLFVKLNIYTPDLDFDGVPNVDSDGKTNYSRKFWYDKYYTTFKVTHNFTSDGAFTQTIEMSRYGLYEAPAEKDSKK